MTAILTTTEDAIIAQVKTAVGDHVREVASLPGAWSRDLLNRLFQKAPACYVTWLGGRTLNGRPGMVDSRVDVIVVTKNARGEAARRRGDGREIGAYDLLGTLIPALQDFVVEGVGTLDFNEVRNVFNEATFDVGATVYAVTFMLPIDLSPTADATSLDDFLRYREQVDQAPADDAIDIATDVDLPAA